jgi:hypothetical protein
MSVCLIVSKFEFPRFDPVGRGALDLIVFEDGHWKLIFVVKLTNPLRFKIHFWMTAKNSAVIVDKKLCMLWQQKQE